MSADEIVGARVHLHKVYRPNDGRIVRVQTFCAHRFAFHIVHVSLDAAPAFTVPLPDAVIAYFRGMEDTWTDRDLPVLRAVVQIYEDTGRTKIAVGDIADAVGFDKGTTLKALRALYTEGADPFFEDPIGSWSADILRVGKPTGRALRAAGQWPTPENIVDRLIAAFEAAADDESRDQPERAKFKQVAAWLGSFASQVAIGALGGAGGRMLGT